MGKDFLYCSRPRLAQMLIDNGYVPTILPNLYNPRFKTWRFDLNPQVKQITIDYYKTVGKEPPQYVVDWEPNNEESADE